MNAITSSLYILKFIKERNSKLRTGPDLIGSNSLFVTIAAQVMQSCVVFLLYKMWIITYLTDVCEKPFESP